MFISLISERLAIPKGQTPDFDAARARAAGLSELDVLDVAAGSDLFATSRAELADGGLAALLDKLREAVDQVERVWNGEGGVYQEQFLTRGSDAGEDFISASVATMGEYPEDVSDVKIMRLFGLAEAAGFLPEPEQTDSEDDEDE